MKTEDNPAYSFSEVIEMLIEIHDEEHLSILRSVVAQDVKRYAIFKCKVMLYAFNYKQELLDEKKKGNSLR